MLVFDSLILLLGSNIVVHTTPSLILSVTLQLNSLFFVNITRVLFLKMFSASGHVDRGYNYRRWFKSTLILVPLFGVHYVFLLIFNSLSVFNSHLELAWLYVDLLFTSFQVSDDEINLIICF